MGMIPEEAVAPSSTSRPTTRFRRDTRRVARRSKDQASPREVIEKLVEGDPWNPATGANSSPVT
jgi:hypothetical protein